MLMNICIIVTAEMGYLYKYGINRLYTYITRTLELILLKCLIHFVDPLKIMNFIESDQYSYLHWMKEINIVVSPISSLSSMRGRKCLASGFSGS